jgi:nucleoside-diphosphate-sugar epimerase
MKLALTGGSGIVGSGILDMAVARGDEVVVLDRVPSPAPRKNVRWIVATTDDYDAVFDAFAGCDAVIHMAALPRPGLAPEHVTHNNNVVGSYNALHAAIAHGIRRICQASSVNAIGLSYSRASHLHYLPVDEKHPNSSEEPYSLSKWICEQQADAFARRYEDVQIASLRFHWVAESRDIPLKGYAGMPEEGVGKHLWGYTLLENAARASLAAIEPGRFTGHEVFYITEPDTASDVPTLELARRYHPGIEIRGALSGRQSLFDSSKARRLLGL